MSKNHADFTGKNNPYFGRHWSEEHKQKMIEINKGKIVTEETRRKMSENHVNSSGKNNPMYGKNHTRETKEKISKSKRWVKKPFATSKYLGVYWSTGSNRWVSFITIDKKTYSKHFEYEIEAALAYNEMAKDCFGWNAILNEISEKEIIELWEKE
jgi:hypothetical protein